MHGYSTNVVASSAYMDRIASCLWHDARVGKQTDYYIMPVMPP